MHSIKKSKILFLALLLLIFISGASFVFAQRELEIRVPNRSRNGYSDNR